MSDITIHNFRYFLEELDKNLESMDVLLAQEAAALENMHVLCNVMSKMCDNWQNQLRHRK